MPRYCSSCNRGLKDPESIRRGMGPDCWAKLQARLDMEKAVKVVPQHHEEVSIQDLPTRPKKVYRGFRTGGEAVVTVDGSLLRHLIYHSPTGLEWGYGGSGPADLARSILFDVAGLSIADTFYQAFKWDMISTTLNRDSFEIQEQDVVNWLKEKIAERNVERRNENADIDELHRQKPGL